MVILYEPFEDEVDYRIKSFPIDLPPKNFVISKSKNNDPIKMAKICVENYKEANPYLLVPGTCFDIFGTRHGRGVGWYDRFLSQVPKSWLRVGICPTSKFFTTQIKRNDWDQLMDWLLIFDGLNWQIHETRARR